MICSGEKYLDTYRYWDIELREIPMEQGRLLMTPEEVIKRCDENTIGVVPTLGVTFTCQYEPVQAVANALDQLEKDQGLDIPIHVDGASGGFPSCLPILQLPSAGKGGLSQDPYGLLPNGKLPR